MDYIVKHNYSQAPAISRFYLFSSNVFERMNGLNNRFKNNTSTNKALSKKKYADVHKNYLQYEE